MTDIERWSKRNEKGEELEKRGNLKDAAKHYEANVEEGAPTLFPYTRLLIIYRRLEDPYNERRVLIKAVKLLQKKKKEKGLDDIEEAQLEEFLDRRSELIGSSEGGRSVKKKKQEAESGGCMGVFLVLILLVATYVAL